MDSRTDRETNEQTGITRNAACWNGCTTMSCFLIFFSHVHKCWHLEKSAQRRTGHVAAEFTREDGSVSS